ncbi:MAG: IS630 family transposase, partial [Leptospiraceae bacterium]|nr:IS630 family transposase [Leptospiraceae bacterium]
KPSTGRPKILKSKDKKFIIDILDNPNKAKVTHWTGIKLHGYLKEKIKLKASYSTLIIELHLADYKLKIPRKMPAQQDEEKRKAFKIELEKLLQDDSNEIWFGDETGIEGDPTPRKRWVRKNQKPQIPYLGKHIRANVIGAICPESGEVSTLVIDYCDTLSFQIFLNQLAEQTKLRSARKKIILILDNAAWHKSSKLNWHHIKPIYLPPYSPDFNPIERLWLRFKKDFFTDFIAKSPKELYNRICRAIKFYIDKPTLVMKTCKIRNSF